MQLSCIRNYIDASFRCVFYLDLCSFFFHPICCRMNFFAGLLSFGIYSVHERQRRPKKKLFDMKMSKQIKRGKIFILNTHRLFYGMLFSHSVEFVCCVFRDSMCCAECWYNKNWQKKTKPLYAQLRESHNIFE